MLKADTDKDWEQLGHSDPYWAVMTQDRFRKDNLDDQNLKDFFAVGERYVARILETIRTHLDAGFRPSRALDFGCGVGRLTLPLTRVCDSVVGVDVSDSMLAEARVHSDAQQLTNVSWIKGDDQLSRVTGGFDLINSYIVLQHIPCHRGQQLLKRLIDLLNEGGVGVIHLTYSRSRFDTDPFSAWPATAPAYSATPLRELRNYWPALRRVIARRIRKLMPGKTGGVAPVMQMNPYTLNPFFHVLQVAGVRRMYLEYTNHGGEYGMILFFSKSE